MASKHDISETALGKDLLQMGVAIESSNSICKAYADNQDQLVKSQINQSLRISQITRVDYKISCLMSSSYTGKKLTEQVEGSEELYMEPLSTQVTMNINLKQFPNDKQKVCEKPIKFSMTQNKFLQLARDMKDAVEIMENVKGFE